MWKSSITKTPQKHPAIDSHQKRFIEKSTFEDKRILWTEYGAPPFLGQKRPKNTPIFEPQKHPHFRAKLKSKKTQALQISKILKTETPNLAQAPLLKPIKRDLSDF